MPLLDSQRKELLALVERGPVPDLGFGLPPRPTTEFNYFSTGEGGLIRHEDPRYSFRILTNDYVPSMSSAFRNTPMTHALLFGVVYEPGRESASEESVGDWSIVPLAVGFWLNYLGRELGAKDDPWAELAAQKELFAAQPADDENAPFTADERAVVVAALNEMLAYIRANAELTVTQLSLVQSEVAALKAASLLSGRGEWRRQLKGTFFTYIAEALVPAPVVRAGMMIVLTATAHIFGIHVPLLPLSPGTPELR